MFIVKKMVLKRIYLIFIIFSATSVYADYREDRKQFINDEEMLAVGSNIILNAKEEVVNKILMTEKHNLKSSSSGKRNKHFYNCKEGIQQSEVFKIIRRMPKGAALNLHDLSISSIDFLLFNITYRDHLYMCTNEDNIKFKFAASDPNEECWKSVQLLREEERFVEDFDDWLRRKLSLNIDNLYEEYGDIDTIFKEVYKITEMIESLVMYRSVFFDYIYRVLEDYYEDNVMYIELYGFLPVLYDLNGTIYNYLDTISILEQINDKFIRDHPDFIGFKYIYSPKTNSTMKQNVKRFEDMKQKYPHFLGGFEIFHQDEPLKTSDQLLEVSKTTNFFFHSNGNDISTNIIDAILLNTTRIGFTYELFQHPLVLRKIKQKQIAVEVCPISNQLLNLVKGPQCNPVGFLLASGYPVVISSCDSYIRDRGGLSYDYYETFMGLANEKADLKLLKQLFVNSLLYSSMTYEEKSDALLRWEHQWNLFLDEFAMEFNYVE